MLTKTDLKIKEACICSKKKAPTAAWAWGPQNTPFQKRLVLFKKNACGHLFSRKLLLGLPIHMRMLLILANIGYCTKIVSNRALCRNYIALAIVPSWGE